MTGASPRLGQVEPRERAGAQTGRKYEYQYERTAVAALDLLSDTGKHVCVYCDWHDDYVVELGDPPTRYVFHQVKGRTASQKPWSFREFFGVVPPKGKPRKKPAAVKHDAVVPRMLLHYATFKDNCAGIAFVTNAGLDHALSAFLQAVGAADCVTSLSGDQKAVFEHLAGAYSAAKPRLTESDAQLFSWIKGLTVSVSQGQLDGPDAALLELADKIEDYSEIDLRQRQAKQIARELVQQVRIRAAHCTTVVPASEDDLRKEKGIVITDLLNVLSLSTPAYKALKAGAQRDVVKTVSRLQRFCRGNGMEEFLVNICEFKVGWDIWRTIERHHVSGVDFLLLEDKARKLLARRLTLSQVAAEANEIAKQFAGIGTTELQAGHVMGLIFSLAAESEAIQ